MNRIRLRFYIRLSAILVICIILALMQYYNHNNFKASKGTLMDTQEIKLIFANKSMREHKLSRLYRRLFNQTISDQQRSESDLKHIISNYNKVQFVQNVNTFGPFTNDSIVILIQVHRSIDNLRSLIKGLSKAESISEVLLIFSHDYYDYIINAIVQAIDFCKVIQIFYPYSIQIYPNEFPGPDPNDCPKNITKKQALVLKCNYALYPDHFGHYREANKTQLKHHWWWKANRVFSELKITKYFTGLVLFLEEDHYVAEDFLHVLKLLAKNKKDLCPYCNVMSLGNYRTQFTLSTYNNNFNVQLFSPQHKTGLAFNRNTWLSIRECAQTFCKFDDYNWDWSLRHASDNCLKQKLTCMAIKGPRVFHIGNCGARKKDCKSRSLLHRVKQTLRFARKSKQLFPLQLKLTEPLVKEKISYIGKGAGNWADPRDHQLCLKMSQESYSNQVGNG